MPAPFKQITREQFALLIERFEFRRRINAVHMHHTWKPEHRDYDPANGHRTIMGMFVHHTQVNKWQDIAQHITIAPDGSIWLGRSWNLPPASAAGHNGNSKVGPFMFEIIGNFDRGHDVLTGEQLQTVIEVIARVQKRFGLPAESLQFHNALSEKSCPGSGVEYDKIVAEVRAFSASLTAPGATGRAARRAPFAADAVEVRFDIEEAAEALSRGMQVPTDSSDAEPTYEDGERALEPLVLSAQADGARGLSAEKLAALRPHLVNLTFGKFSRRGDWKTDVTDVDAIFDQHLREALRLQQLKSEPLRVLFFAHGGLVKESAGLEIAYKHLKFWKDNGVYPIYIVWETGLCETIAQLLRRSREGARGLDEISDALIEKTARALQGPRIWGGMKLSAQMGVAAGPTEKEDGGARYIAKRLADFCHRNAGAPIELHAAGHSAGSIFHAHFLSTAKSVGVPSFKSVHLLAPAIRVDAFHQLLHPLVGSGKGVDHLTMLTMAKPYERKDNCFQVYRKSLLYLIHNALEPEEEEPIMGLEQSLRADPKLVALFGLGTTGSAAAEVVFSKSVLATGRSATRSTTHGGFDDDAPTMGSVARRILRKQDADSIVEYQPAREARAADIWIDQVDWPERLLEMRLPATVLPPIAPSVAASAPPLSALAPARMPRVSGAGRRMAVCIGINDYPSAPLNGCIADSEEWRQCLQRLGFQVRTLHDTQATRAAIIEALESLITESTPGDVLVFQYAGHGTYLQDIDGDEEDDFDEALCPHDYERGAFLIDDDLRGIMARIPEGVNLTCFFDCCHSGTTTRVGAAIARPPGNGDIRRRFLRPTAQMQQQHVEFRRSHTPSRSHVPAFPTAMRNVSFAACQDDQSAYESNGRGDFTVRAARILAAGLEGLTNEQFAERVMTAFGNNARQLPRLDCDRAARSRGLLQPLTEVVAAAATMGPQPTAASHPSKDEIVSLLVSTIHKVETL